MQTNIRENLFEKNNGYALTNTCSYYIMAIQGTNVREQTFACVLEE